MQRCSSPKTAPLSREATGAVRAGAPLPFPTETVKASTIFPDLDNYQGPPLEFGRMEPTASDPSVQQQYGMIAGVPNAGQLNALATLNIRGERSVTCRGDFDRHPSEGPLPPGAPPICEHFRQLPDALERAAELDALYGRNPDLEKMPMYGVVFSFKDPFDTKDMRTTAGGDAAYDIDFPARDHVLVEQLRNKGAIIFAKAVCTEYNGRAGDPGGRHKPEKVLPSVFGYQRSSWGGNPSNPYDTTRAASLGSSSGSGVSVSANLVMVSLGEETRASTRGPANHNAVALILPHKAMLSFNGGAIGADIYCDRSGILARTIGDAAKVLDALKDPEPAITTRATPTRPCRAPRCWRRLRDHAKPASASLKGMRIGVIREVDAAPPRRQGGRADRHRRRGRDQGDPRRQARRDSGRISDPLWERDRDLEQMNPDFRQGLARLVPVFMPDLLFRLGPDGAAGLQGIRRGDPADRVPAGQGLRQRHDGADRLLRGAGRRPDRAARQPRHRHDPGAGARDVVPLPRPPVPVAPRRRLAARGFTEGLADFAALNARSKFWGDDGRAGFKNWEEVTDPRNPLGGRQGVDERIMLRELLRRLDMMVILENRLDALVRLHTPLPPAKIGGANDPLGGRNNLRTGILLRPERRPDRGADPGGLRDDVYDPVFALSPDRTRYVSVPPTPRPPCRPPACPSRWFSAPSPAKRRRPPEDRLRLRSRLEAPLPPPAFGRLARV